MTTIPQCNECNSPGQLVSGAAIYPHRPDLHSKQLYRCPVCPNTYVGCHEGTTTPLGRMAGPELRAAKQRVHAVFDPLWKEKMQRDGLTKKKARTKAYRWLAEQLTIPYDQCHIGMFDVATCDRAEAICKPYARRIEDD